MRYITKRTCSRCGLRRPINDEKNVWCFGCTTVIGQCNANGVEPPQFPGREKKLRLYRERASRGLPVLGEYGPTNSTTVYEDRQRRGLCGRCGVRPPDEGYQCCKVCKGKARDYYHRKKGKESKKGKARKIV